MFRSHERSWSQFENTPPKTITVRAIPWPPADEDLLRGSVALAMTEQVNLRISWKVFPHGVAYTTPAGCWVACTGC